MDFTCLITLCGLLNSAPVISLTFDDARTSQYVYGLSVLESRNLTGTLFVPTKLIGTDAFMTWDMVKTMSNAGWEIGSHTETHLNMLENGSNIVEAELENSFNTIKNKTGIVPVSFASPYGSYNDLTNRIVMQYYDVHLMAWGGTKGWNNLYNYEHYEISRFEIEHYHTSKEICDIISNLKNNEWFIVNIHQIVNDKPNEYQINLHTFEEIADCINQRQDDGFLQVKNVADVIK